MAPVLSSSKVTILPLTYAVHEEEERETQSFPAWKRLWGKRGAFTGDTCAFTGEQGANAYLDPGLREGSWLDPEIVGPALSGKLKLCQWMT